ncbi:MAG: GNAT family N-acetyltransferase [Cyclobacteriaceae bacterium]|nr:GNAT family N-acetyltransferase [Cyclobacteriaceae bacterium]
MTIREASLEDRQAIRRLLGQLGYPELSESDVASNIISHQQKDYAMLVGEMDDKVIGFIALHWFDVAHWKAKIGRISAFCVDDSSRSQGVGQKMLEHAEGLLLSKGCAKIEVTSNARRTRAHQFYLRLGYVEDSRRFVKYAGKTP